MKPCLQPATMIFLAFFVLAASQVTNAQHNIAPLQLNPVTPQDNTISSRFNYFDLELLMALDDKQNYFISSASIKTTLGMVLEGARGRCAEEISKVLRIPTDSTNARDKLQSLLYNLNVTTGSTLVESANGVFVSDAFHIVSEYQKNLQKYYSAEVRSLNFADNAAASEVINNWVRNATRGWIKDIVSPENFNADATLLITNALYFKGLWKNEFDERSTSIKCFHSKRNSCVNTKMMQTVDNFYYKFIDDLDAQAIQLPYGDGKYAMLVLLPSEKHSVDGLIRDLQHITFASIVSRLEPTEVLISLPKFDIDFSGDIVPVLQNLGIIEIFNENANLSGIVEQGRVKVSNIVHKAKIEVNEKGTTAAAATGVIVIPLMGSSMPRFIADRPFLFFIYNVESNNILFEGRLNEPHEVYDEIFTKVPLAQPTRQTVIKNYKQQAPSLLDDHQRPESQVFYPTETKTPTNAFPPSHSAQYNGRTF